MTPENTDHILQHFFALVVPIKHMKLWCCLKRKIEITEKWNSVEQRVQPAESRRVQMFIWGTCHCILIRLEKICIEPGVGIGRSHSIETLYGGHTGGAWEDRPGFRSRLENI